MAWGTIMEIHTAAMTPHTMDLIKPPTTTEVAICSSEEPKIMAINNHKVSNFSCSCIEDSRLVVSRVYSYLINPTLLNANASYPI